MQSVWLKGVDKKDHEARRRTVLGYRNAFEDLKTILDFEMPTSTEVKPDFSKAGWEGDLAFQLGMKEALRRVLKLIDIKEKD